MSYITVEVEIDHGKVVAKAPAQLPEKASGLLTILHEEIPAESSLTRLQALDALLHHLQLNASQASTWMANVQAARR